MRRIAEPFRNPGQGHVRLLKIGQSEVTADLILDVMERRSLRPEPSSQRTRMQTQLRGDPLVAAVLGAQEPHYQGTNLGVQGRCPER